MSTTEKTPTEHPDFGVTSDALQAMQALVEAHVAPSVIPIEAGTVLVHEEGRKVLDLTALHEARLKETLPGTRHAAGYSKHQTLASIIAYANRFKRPETAAACHVAHHGDVAGPMAKLVVSFDFHPTEPAVVEGLKLHGGRVGFGAVYEFPTDPAWQLFGGVDNKSLSVQEFGEFIEKALQYVRDPKAVEADELPGTRYGLPSDLLKLSSGMRVNVDRKVANVSNRHDGSGQVVFSEANATEDSNGIPVEVPGAFVVTIPVFLDGVIYVQSIRLRYKVTSGQVRWTIERHNPHHTVRDAVREAREKFATDTGIPTFEGTLT